MTAEKEGMLYCDAHHQTQQTLALLTNNLQHLKDAVVRIDEHMEAASKTRTTWWIAIAGIIATVIVQTFVFAYFLGIYSRQVEINTGRIDRLEMQHSSKHITVQQNE